MPAGLQYIDWHDFYCQTCGAAQDLDWETFSSLQLDRLRAGIEVGSYEVTVRGQCDCCTGG